MAVQYLLVSPSHMFKLQHSILLAHQGCLHFAQQPCSVNTEAVHHIQVACWQPLIPAMLACVHVIAVHMLWEDIKGSCCCCLQLHVCSFMSTKWLLRASGAKQGQEG